MKVKLQDLVDGPLKIERQIPCETVGLGKDEEYSFEKPVEVQLRLTKISESVLVEGSLKAWVKMPCVRCLKWIEIPLETIKLSVVYMPKHMHDQELDHGPLVLEPNEDDVSFYEQEEIDLAEEIRDSIMVELPAFPKCKEDCLKVQLDQNTDNEEVLPEWKRKLKDINLN